MISLFSGSLEEKSDLPSEAAAQRARGSGNLLFFTESAVGI